MAAEVLARPCLRAKRRSREHLRVRGGIGGFDAAASEEHRKYRQVHLVCDGKTDGIITQRSFHKLSYRLPSQQILLKKGDRLAACTTSSAALQPFCKFDSAPAITKCIYVKQSKRIGSEAAIMRTFHSRPEPPKLSHIA